MRARTARAQLVLVALIAGPAALSLACGTRQCNATNCQDGCCDAEGMCWVGGSDDYCGQGGHACIDCSASGMRCKETGTACCGQTGNSCSSDANCCEGAYSFDKFYCESRDGGSTCQACKSYGQCAESRECCPSYTCQYDTYYGYSRCK